MRPSRFAPVITLATLAMATAGAAPPVPGESLLLKIVARLESDSEALRHFTFREELHVEHRDREGEIRSRERESSEIFHQDGRRMRRTLVDGRESSVPQAARVDQEPPLDLKEVAACFSFTPAIKETLADRTALRLEFAALPGCLQAPDRAARILANLHGRLWVDPEGYQLIRLEGSLSAPVTFGFGLLGKVERFDLEVERQAVSPGLFAMTRVEYHAQGRMFPGRRFDLRNRRDRNSFQRISGDALSSTTTIPSQSPASDPDRRRRNQS